MQLVYDSYEAARKNFKWSERWDVFDGDRANLNIAHECVDRHPKKDVAVRLKRDDGGRESYTFDQLSRLSSQFAHMLEKRGINAGDRVGIILNPSIEYYVSFYGTLKRGAVAVPCYALLGPDGIEYRLKDSGAKMAIVYEDNREKVNPGLVDHLLSSEDIIEMIKDEEESYETDTSFDSLGPLKGIHTNDKPPTFIDFLLKGNSRFVELIR